MFLQKLQKKDAAFQPRLFLEKAALNRPGAKLSADRINFLK